MYTLMSIQCCSYSYYNLTPSQPSLLCHAKRLCQVMQRTPCILTIGEGDAWGSVTSYMSFVAHWNNKSSQSFSKNKHSLRVVTQ